MSNGSNPPKPRGCLFYGCLSVAIITFVLALMLCIGLYIAKQKLSKLIENYTDTAPQTIESVTYEPAERTALQSKVDAFTTRLNKGESDVELVLTAKELNILIAENPDWRGKLFVELEDDQVKGKVSVPLPDFGPFKLKGRYLNGTVGLRVTLEDAKLSVRANSVEVRGKPLPATIMTQLKKENLAENATKDPKTAQELGKFKSLQIQDGKVIIRGR